MDGAGACNPFVKTSTLIALTPQGWYTKLRARSMADADFCSTGSSPAPTEQTSISDLDISTLEMILET